MNDPLKYPVINTKGASVNGPVEPFQTVFGWSPDPSLNITGINESGCRLLDLASDLFLIGLNIGNGGNTGEPAALKKLLLNYLMTYEHHCFSSGFSRVHISDSMFALTAWLDECIMHRGGDLNDYWSRETLTVKYFNNSLAGEKFFIKLEELGKDPGDNSEVLVIYYLCLEFGFEGRYKLGDDNVLQVRRGLWKKIAGNSDKRGGVISPAAGTHPGKGPPEPGNKKWYYISLTTAVLFLFMYLVLYYLTTARADAASAVLENIHRTFHQSEL